VREYQWTDPVDRFLLMVALLAAAALQEMVEVGAVAALPGQHTAGSRRSSIDGSAIVYAAPVQVSAMRLERVAPARSHQHRPEALVSASPT
jgi:hypothetical protein